MSAAPLCLPIPVQLGPAPLAVGGGCLRDPPPLGATRSSAPAAMLPVPGVLGTSVVPLPTPTARFIAARWTTRLIPDKRLDLSGRESTGKPRERYKAAQRGGMHYLGIILRKARDGGENQGKREVKATRWVSLHSRVTLGDASDFPSPLCTNA